MPLQDKLKKLEQHIQVLSSDEKFIHHKWYFKHHLKIVEEMGNQLCDLYPDANRNVVMAIVWLHDLGKIILHTLSDRSQEISATLSQGRLLLDNFGFPSDFTDKVVADLAVFEQARTLDLSKENIEVRISSTADGCSHFSFPFFYAVYWYENTHKTVDELIAENRRASTYDWENKIVLPGIKELFKDKISAIKDYNPDDIGKVFQTT